MNFWLFWDYVIFALSCVFMAKINQRGEIWHRHHTFEHAPTRHRYLTLAIILGDLFFSSSVVMNSL